MAPDRRRPSTARLSYDADPRRLRELLASVEDEIGHHDPRLRCKARMLVGEIVARLITACPRTPIHLDIELMDGCARIDISTPAAEACNFWEVLDDAVFSDLTSTWGRDRRGGGNGAWFELASSA